jgi:hypothetical protein
VLANQSQYERETLIQDICLAIAIELGSCSKSQERSTSEQRQFQERSVETVVIDFDALLKSQGVVGKCVTKDVGEAARIGAIG